MFFFFFRENDIAHHSVSWPCFDQYIYLKKYVFMYWAFIKIIHFPNVFVNIPRILKTEYIPNTKRIQASIHISIAVKPSAFGEFVVMVLKILIKTRNTVTSNAIRPEDLKNIWINSSSADQTWAVPGTTMADPDRSRQTQAVPSRHPRHMPWVCLGRPEQT